ncbi:MAG: type II secretion system F family protein, partial [Candidatus Spechtbacteria bacterium]|nr:type II secretion system F family protein [Candidatus Spechtbacteria bacterium]
MIAVGEKTGQLDSILRNVSKFYEEEVQNTVDNLVSLIEPILIVIMGIGAAFLMAGILLPIYTSISAVQ